jgi:hypothetical protein
MTGLFHNLISPFKKNQPEGIKIKIFFLFLRLNVLDESFMKKPKY